MSNATSRMIWEEVARKGPMGLTRLHWESLLPDLPQGAARKILAMFLEGLEEQSRWIDKRTAAMRDEAEHIALVGTTMKRAGLRSYTDEKGRIFVAGRSKP